MVLVHYNYTYEDALFDLIESEPELVEYIEHRNQYRLAIESSTVYVLMDESVCIGYIRGRDDSGFGFYIYDLLVRKSHRGHGYGKKLIDHLKSIYQPVFVMSDVDPYYEKIGMKKIGSIFE